MSYLLSSPFKVTSPVTRLPVRPRRQTRRISTNEKRRAGDVRKSGWFIPFGLP